MNLTKQQKMDKVNSDARLWLKNFVKIPDNNGDLIPFVVNKQQEYFLDHMEKKNIILKARQQGFSTLSLGLCLWMACNRPNTNYLIVSYKLESSTALFERLKIMFRSLPFDKYHFPKATKDNKNELVLENNSRIACVVAGNKDIARGGTNEYILLSEFAFYQDQQRILTACESSLAKNADSKIVIETTANGWGFFRDMFFKAHKGKSAYKAFFFNWYDNKEMFKSEYEEAKVWWKSNNSGIPLREKELEPNEKELYKKGATLYQLCWRRWKLLDMDERMFNQEFPFTPESAFISTNEGVFDMIKLLERQNYLPVPLKREEIKIDIPESLDPYLNRGLFIYQVPVPDERYWAGVDTASGTGNNNDNSAISLFNSLGEQVCVFFSNKTLVYKFAKIVNDLCLWYNYAFVCVERNSYGLGVLERLKKDYGYLNLYKQFIFDQQGKRKHQLGYSTTTTSKAKLINDFVEEFEEGLILINDSHTLEEMKIYQEKDGKLGNIRGVGNNDDLVIAAALAIQAIKINKWYL